MAPLPLQLSSKSFLHDLCANMNRRHRSAQLAGRASVQLHTVSFFGSGPPREEDAYVLDVETAEKADPSIRVIIPNYGVEGQVKVPVALDDPKLVRLPKENKIIFNEGTSIQVFDKVRVKISVHEIQAFQKELIIELISPTFNLPEQANKRRAKVKTGSSKKQKYKNRDSN